MKKLITITGIILSLAGCVIDRRGLLVVAAMDAGAVCVGCGVDAHLPPPDGGLEPDSGMVDVPDGFVFPVDSGAPRVCPTTTEPGFEGLFVRDGSTCFWWNGNGAIDRAAPLARFHDANQQARVSAMVTATYAGSSDHLYWVALVPGFDERDGCTAWNAYTNTFSRQACSDGYRRLDMDE